MDIVQVLRDLFAGLSANLGSDAAAILVTTILAVLMTGFWLAVQAFRKTEFYKQHRAMWELIDNRIADLIWLVEFGDVNLDEYAVRVDAREAAGLSYVDPRMLYLLDQAQAYIKTTFGVTIDIEVLLARAEHIFDEVKHSPDNGVGDN